MRASASLTVAAARAATCLSLVPSFAVTAAPAAVFFMHFWANDDAVKLAQGLRGALDKMAVKLTASR
jgi:hypothetical protein